MRRILRLDHCKRDVWLEKEDVVGLLVALPDGALPPNVNATGGDLELLTDVGLEVPPRGENRGRDELRPNLGLIQLLDLPLALIH